MEKFPIPFVVAEFADNQYQLDRMYYANFAAIQAAGGCNHMFEGGLTYEDVYWVLRKKHDEERCFMPANKAWAKKISHHIDETTNELIVDGTGLENSDGDNFGVFTIGPIECNIRADIDVRRNIQWPEKMNATEEQIRLIKARNWEGYLCSFHNPLRFSVDICLVNVHAVVAENMTMARIFAENTGKVQVNVSDYRFFNNRRLHNPSKCWGITKRTSKGIRRIHNKKLRVCINV